MFFMHEWFMTMYFGRSKCEASTGHWVILYQSGFPTLLFSEYISQANSNRLMCFNSAWKGFVLIFFGNQFYFKFGRNTNVHGYIYIYVNVFHALNVIMFFRGSKCEAFAGHGVILYQFGCSTLLFSDYIGKTNF